MKLAKILGWFLVISGPITFLAGLFVAIIASIDLPFQGSPSGYSPLWQTVVFLISVFLVPGIVTLGGFCLIRPTRKSKRFKLILGILVSIIGIGGISFFGVNFISSPPFAFAMSILMLTYFALILMGGLYLIRFKGIEIFTYTIPQLTEDPADVSRE
jgi:hypothetical protein